MFHIEIADVESREMEPTSWDAWAESVENSLGHELDADNFKNGHSLGAAYAAWEAGVPDAVFAARITANPHYKVWRYANWIGFESKHVAMPSINTTGLPEPADIGRLVDSLGETPGGHRRKVADVAARALEEMVELCLATGLNSGAILSTVADALANQAIKQGHHQMRTVFPSEIAADTGPLEVAAEVADVRLTLKDLVWVAGNERVANAKERNIIPELLKARDAGDLYLDRAGTLRRRKAHVLQSIVKTVSPAQ